MSKAEERARRRELRKAEEQARREGFALAMIAALFGVLLAA